MHASTASRSPSLDATHKLFCSPSESMLNPAALIQDKAQSVNSNITLSLSSVSSPSTFAVRSVKTRNVLESFVRSILLNLLLQMSKDYREKIVML